MKQRLPNWLGRLRWLARVGISVGGLGLLSLSGCGSEPPPAPATAAAEPAEKPAATAPEPAPAAPAPTPTVPEPTATVPATTPATPAEPAPAAEVPVTGEEPAPPVVAAPPAPDPKLEDGIYAKIETTKGPIYCRLFHDQAIRTVGSFVGLAEGTLTWTDPTTAEKKEKTPYYDGLKFHRVEPEFVIQTGDPLNTGEGGPGFKLPDEYYPELRFDKPGMMGMARTQMPGSAGSQFFITMAPIPQLNDQYTVFGEVVQGMDVVAQIKVGDAMKAVTILRIGATAKAYDFAAAVQARIAALNARLPEKLPEADPTRIPDPKNPAVDEVVVRACMLVYKGSMLEGAYTDRTKEEAKAVAEKVVALTRAKDADTAKLLKEFSEVPASHPMHMQKQQLPEAFQSVFHLKVGQVCDPLEGPYGWIIFARVEPVKYHASHILIQFKGSMRATTERSKEEALKLAEDLRTKIVAKPEVFADLAKANSDDPTNKDKGGELGEWEEGEMVPEFDTACAQLKIGEVSPVVETAFGYHIILRQALEVKQEPPEPEPLEGGIELPLPMPAPAVPEPAPEAPGAAPGGEE